MLWAGLHTPKIHIEALTPILQNQVWTIFGDKVFKEVINMRSLGCVLIQYDWHL